MWNSSNVGVAFQLDQWDILRIHQDFCFFSGWAPSAVNRAALHRKTMNNCGNLWIFPSRNDPMVEKIQCIFRATSKSMPMWQQIIPTPLVETWSKQTDFSPGIGSYDWTKDPSPAFLHNFSVKLDEPKLHLFSHLIDRFHILMGRHAPQ